MADVPEDIQNKIDRERFIDQTERWAIHKKRNNYRETLVASQAIVKLVKEANVNPEPPTRVKENSPIRVQIRSPTEPSKRKALHRVRISSDDT